MQAMRWSRTHTDTYHHYDGVWLKVRCRIEPGMDCAAPKVLPRGTKFGYSVRETDGLMDAAEAAMCEYAE